MTPQPSSQLAGKSTTLAGILSLVFGGLSLFTHIWGAAHGATLDPNTLMTGGGLVAAGISGLVAADAKQ